jgi:hypothetical protein
VLREDPDVLPTMKDTGFTLLKVPEAGWAKREYNVSGAPTNFLLDAEGRIVFRPRVNNRETQRTMEQEIESLLAHPPAHKK